MKEFLKNQRNAFFVFIALIFVILILWYFPIHQNIQLSYDTNKAQHKEINNNKVLYKKMEKRIPEIEAEWKVLTSSFQKTLDKIPHKQNYDNAVNALYNFSDREFTILKTITNINNEYRSKYLADDREKSNNIKFN